MKRYAIWDKVSPVYTPVGEVLTPEQWIERYPIAGVPTMIVVCSAGEINGGFFSTLGQFTSTYAAQGCDFQNCNTPEDMLEVIEAFEDHLENKAKLQREHDAFMAEMNTNALMSIAASMEYQNMLSLPDEEDELV